MSLFTSDQLAFLEKLDATGTAPKPFPTWTDPKPKNWQPPDDSWANRRKPRMSVTPQMGEIRPDPFPLDFCVWIQSNEFGYNRRYILKSIGATWLGDDAKINQEVSGWLTGLQERLNTPVQ